MVSLSSSRLLPSHFPRLTASFEASFVRDESSASNADDVAAIPSQLKVTQQILSHWQPFRDLKNLNLRAHVVLNS